MTTRIRDPCVAAARTGPCLVADLDLVRDNYNAFAKALPDTRVYYAVKANPLSAGAAGTARLASTPPRSPRSRWCWRRVRPPTASPMATPRRRRDIARAHALGGGSSRSTAWPRLRRSRGRPGLAGVLPHPLRLRRRSLPSAVRLRARDGDRRAQHAHRLGSGLRRVVPRRLPAAQPACLGPGAGFGGRGVPQCGERGLALSMVNLGG